MEDERDGRHPQLQPQLQPQVQPQRQQQQQQEQQQQQQEQQQQQQQEQQQQQQNGIVIMLFYKLCFILYSKLTHNIITTGSQILTYIDDQ